MLSVGRFFVFLLFASGYCKFWFYRLVLWVQKKKNKIKNENVGNFMSIKIFVTIISFLWIFLIVCVKCTRLIHLSLLLHKPMVYKNDSLNLVEKFKKCQLSQNLVSTIISIFRIEWWCSFFLFSTGNSLFE